MTIPKPIVTKPLTSRDQQTLRKGWSTEEQFWRDQFQAECVKQTERFEDFAKELIKVELGIIGIYLSVLKWLSGNPLKNPTSDFDLLMNILSFTFWLFALGLSAAALFPLKYTVQGEFPSDIKRFYQNTARNKRDFLFARDYDEALAFLQDS